MGNFVLTPRGHTKKALVDQPMRKSTISVNLNFVNPSGAGFGESGTMPNSPLHV